MEQDVSQEDWARHRAIQDASGVDRGLFGRDVIAAYHQDRAQHRFGRVQANGHLTAPSVPGSVAIPRVYASQIEGESAHYARTADLGSSGDGWS